MEVKTCKQCKRLYNYLSGPPICPACKDRLEEKFQLVKDYVIEHPLEGIAEVAEVNEVSVSQIKRWVREERLSFSPESTVGIDCEGCGATIRTGRYCESCKKKMNIDFQSLYPKDESYVQKKQKEAARMRFLDDK